MIPLKCFEAVGVGAAEPFSAMTARARRERTREPGDRSCKPDDLKVLDTGDCLDAMKQARILAVGGRRNQVWNAITGQLGIEVVDVPYAELNAAWEAADKERSSELADRWQRTARRIEGVSRQTLEDSAAMCLAQKELLARHGANAITVDCLGGFSGNHIHAYPCLGFHELSNNGLIGACECDLHSTATMVALTAMTQGRPPPRVRRATLTARPGANQPDGSQRPPVVPVALLPRAGAQAAPADHPVAPRGQGGACCFSGSCRHR